MAPFIAQLIRSSSTNALPANASGTTAHNPAVISATGAPRPVRVLAKATPAPTISTAATAQPSQPIPYRAPCPASSSTAQNSTAQPPAAYPAQDGHRRNTPRSATRSA